MGSSSSDSDKEFTKMIEKELKMEQQVEDAMQKRKKYAK
jgi:hypothetical protein